MCPSVPKRRANVSLQEHKERGQTMSAGGSEEQGIQIKCFSVKKFSWKTCMFNISHFYDFFKKKPASFFSPLSHCQSTFLLA